MNPIFTAMSRVQAAAYDLSHQGMTNTGAQIMDPSLFRVAPIVAQAPVASTVKAASGSSNVPKKAASSSSLSPVVIVGGLALAAAVAFVILRKKKSKR